MAKKNTELSLHDEVITSKIYLVRGQKVMLDRDLAELYGVETRTLNQAVKRNERRFPDNFMFQLTEKDMSDWKSQIVISNREKNSVQEMDGLTDLLTKHHPFG